MIRPLTYLLILFALFGCSSSNGPTYRLGVDSTFYPLNLGEKDINVFAFFNELIAKVAKKNHIKIERVNRSWNNLILGLREESYDAMISAMTPRAFNTSTYNFSDIILPTGPVIVTAKESEIKNEKDLSGKIVSVSRYSQSEIQLSRNLSIDLRTYTQVPEALTQLSEGKLEAVIVDVIPAISFVNDLFANDLKIVDAPIFQEGLRVVNLKNESQEIINIFNKTIEEMKKSGEYQKLMQKWGVGL